jgi:hypothetical protein
MNSWIDDQRGAETVWVKGDPQYEKDELIKKAQDSLAYRAWAPIEALIFPQQTEVITKTDVGKTFQQMNDFEGPLGWLAYVGRFAPSTLVSTAIAGGGWGTPEQIKAIKGGKDILSYTPDLGDWITDHAENMGLISEETSNHWWTNAIVGGLITVPVMLAEPDILTPVIAGAGTLAGGPVGGAGGFLLAKGSKGLKALPTLGKLKRISKVAEDGKEMLAKVADESSDIKFREATKVLGSLTGSTGRVVRNVLASVLSTNNPSNRLKNTIAKQIDELQESRKAAPEVVESLEKIEDLEEYLNLPGADPEKLAELLAGNEENLVKYYQSKALANKLLDEEMQLNRRLANSYSQFKPKQQSAKEYRELTGALENSYKQLDEVEAAINKSGATDALRQQRSKAISDIQKNQRLLSKANAEQALEIASKRADVANELLFKSAKKLEDVRDFILKNAKDPEVKAKVGELTKDYEKQIKAIKGDKFKAGLGAEALYEALEATLDDVLESTKSVQKNLGVKTKDYGVTELKDSLRTLYGTDKIDDVVSLFDRSFGTGEFAKYVEKSGSEKLRNALDGEVTEIDADLYGELQDITAGLVREGVEKQKSELGVELGEQLLKESEFMRTITSVVGNNYARRAFEFVRDFTDPARKKYGSTAEDIVSTGRARDSLAKRSQSEIGDVFTAKADPEDLKKTREDVLENTLTEAQAFIDGVGDPGEHAAALLKFLNKKGKPLAREQEVKLLSDFLKSPNEKIIDEMVQNAARRRRLKDLMTTTDPVLINPARQEYTMTNVGKSSWWDLSKSWWRRSATLGEGALDETLDLYVKTFVESGQTMEASQKAAAIMKKQALKILDESPDIDLETFNNRLRASVPRNLKVAPQRDRELAMQAAVLSAASSQERAMFDLLRRTGTLTKEEVDSWRAFVAGTGDEVPDMRIVLKIAQRYGIEISRDTFGKASGDTKALLRDVEVEGKFALIPTDLMASISDNLKNITKELAEFNPKGDQAAKMFQNSLSSIARTWRTSIITGLVFPNPVHFTNIFFGNFSQIWSTVDFSTAVRITAQSLKSHVPYFGGKVDNILAENQAKYGNNKALASTYNAMLNPHVNGFFNRSLAKDTDKVYDASGKLLGTWGEIRDGAARNGVLSSFVGTDIRQALSRSMAKRTQATGFKKGALNVWEKYIKGDAYSQFAETIEQRQRVALYLDLISRKGMSPESAAKKVKEALYDWDAPLSGLEADYLNNFFLFWRFWKLSIGQAGKHIFDPFIKPPEKTTDLIKYSLYQKSPASRTLAQARLAMGAPELAYDKQMSDIQDRIEDGTATDQDRYMALLSMVYPSWRKGGNKVFLYNYPLDAQAADQYSRVFGKDVTHEAVTMPGFTMLDTYGLVFSTLGSLSGVAVSSGRLATGWDSEDLSVYEDVIKKSLDTLIEPALELANPAVESALDGIKDVLSGNMYEYRQVKTKLKPSERQAFGVLDKLLSTGLVEYKIGEESEAVYASKLIMDLYRLTPVLGTQLSRNFDPFIEVAEQDEYAKGLMHVLRQLTGVAKTYSYNPEQELNRLTYKFKDESRKLKAAEKYRPVSEKPAKDE